ncbi:hypothetical protein HDU93_000943 [Gonapodya sp. JEL0774]|nr:hypothetical protein HDU93_000943 [Gonapodya sp. JEL0774]
MDNDIPLKYLATDLAHLDEALSVDKEKWRIPGWDQLTPQDRKEWLRPREQRRLKSSSLFQSRLEQIITERKHANDNVHEHGDVDAGVKRRKLSSHSSQVGANSSLPEQGDGPQASSAASTSPDTKHHQLDHNREAIAKFSAFLESIDSAPPESIKDEDVAVEVEAFATVFSEVRGTDFHSTSLTADFNGPNQPLSTLDPPLSLNRLPTDLAHRISDLLLTGATSTSLGFSASVTVCQVLFWGRFCGLPLPPASTVQLRIDLLKLCRIRPNVAIDGCLVPALTSSTGLVAEQAKFLEQVVSAKDDGLSPTAATTLVEHLARRFDKAGIPLAEWGNLHAQVLRTIFDNPALTAAAPAFVSVLAVFPADFRRTPRFGSLVQNFVSNKIRRLENTTGDGGSSLGTDVVEGLKAGDALLGLHGGSQRTPPSIEDAVAKFSNKRVIFDISKGESAPQQASSTNSEQGEFILESELPKPFRVLGPRSMATMDFRSNRLNLHVDEQNFRSSSYILYPATTHRMLRFAGNEESEPPLLTEVNSSQLQLGVFRSATSPVTGDSSAPWRVSETFVPPETLESLNQEMDSLLQAYRMVQEADENRLEVVVRVNALRNLATACMDVSRIASRLASSLDGRSRSKSPRPPLTISVKAPVKRTNTVSTPQTAIPLGHVKQAPQTEPALHPKAVAQSVISNVSGSNVAASNVAQFLSPIRYGTVTCSIGHPPCGETFICSSDPVGFDSDGEDVTYLEQGNKRVDHKFCPWVEHVRNIHRVQASQLDKEVSYACPLCEFRSSRDGNVYSHLLIQQHHPHTKHFFCPVCKDAPSFRDKHGAARHFKDVHGRGANKRRRRKKHREQNNVAPAGSESDADNNGSRRSTDDLDSDASSRPSSYGSYTSGEESIPRSLVGASGSVSEINSMYGRFGISEMGSFSTFSPSDSMFSAVSNPFAAVGDFSPPPATGFDGGNFMIGSHIPGMTLFADDQMLGLESGNFTPTATVSPLRPTPARSRHLTSIHEAELASGFEWSQTSSGGVSADSLPTSGVALGDLKLFGD